MWPVGLGFIVDMYSDVQTAFSLEVYECISFRFLFSKLKINTYHFVSIEIITVHFRV